MARLKKDSVSNRTKSSPRGIDLNDELTNRLIGLKGEVPQGRTGLSEAEKDELIKQVGGPATASSIVKAKKDFPRTRIPFLFSSLLTQAVVDILENDMEAAIERALAAKRCD